MTESLGKVTTTGSSNDHFREWYRQGRYYGHVAVGSSLPVLR